MVAVQRLIRAGVVLASATLLSSCMLAADVTTLHEYAPADGTRVAITDTVAVENILVVTEGEGEVGHLVGVIRNNGIEDVEVLIDPGETGAPSPFDVPARGSVSLHDANVTIASVPVAPGGTLPTSVQGPGGFHEIIEIPVLDGTLEEYAQFLENADSPETAS